MIAKLSKSEREFIRELRKSKNSTMRILNLVPPTHELDFIDLRSMIYIFDFADQIRFTMPLEEPPIDAPVYVRAQKWAEIFFKMVPPEYIEGRLKLDMKGDLDRVLPYFQRGTRYLKPLSLILSHGKIEFKKVSKTLTFLYGCQTVELRNMRLKLVETTERLTEIDHRIRTLILVDVVESCPFTETSVKAPSLRELIIKNSMIKLEGPLLDNEG